MTDTTTHVAIVGAGPVGVTVANLLGTYGIETVVLDRSTEIIDYPRAVGVDDEALRVFQACGLADRLIADIIQNVPLRLFDARARCFAEIQPGTREFGWYRRNIFMQQLAERTLRDGLQRFDHVSLWLGHDVTSHVQDDEGVTLTARDATGRERKIRARYCVAADGGRSTLRDLLGVPMIGNTHPIKWVVVDTRNAEVDAPYTALHCDPRRPHVSVYLPYRFRRWEFFVFPGEDVQAMAEPANIRRLLASHLADPEGVEIVRARVYTHHSRIVERFVVGRTIFVGDAAHLMPPWIGQGLNVGIRDAGNLAWKLAGIVRGQLTAAVLHTYESERRGHVESMTRLADMFGAILMPISRLKAALRDQFFRLVRRLPSVRDYVLQMRFKPMPRYRAGFVLDESRSSSSPVGRMFIQPTVETADGRFVPLDTVLGDWMVVLGWQIDPRSLLSDDDRDFWDSLDARFVTAMRSRSHDRDRSSRPSNHVEDVENQLASWFAAANASIVVLRPDRYVAAVATASQFSATTAAFRSLVRGRRAGGGSGGQKCAA